MRRVCQTRALDHLAMLPISNIMTKQVLSSSHSCVMNNCKIIYTVRLTVYYNTYLVKIQYSPAWGHQRVGGFPLVDGLSSEIGGLW